jgi:hypothetical protein
MEFGVEEREQTILRTLARGGLDTRQLTRLEQDLLELRESRVREEQWRQLTQATVQPRWKHADPW